MHVVGRITLLCYIYPESQILHIKRLVEWVQTLIPLALLLRQSYSSISHYTTVLHQYVWILTPIIQYSNTDIEFNQSPKQLNIQMLF